MISRRMSLVIPAPIHQRVYGHLFPGDGLEAAALLLCSEINGRRRKLVVRDVVLVPHAACRRRKRDALTWPGEYVEATIDAAETEKLAVIAIHSHPGEWFGFSELDDASDRLLMPALLHGTDRDPGSAIMIPGGAVRARTFGSTGRSVPIDLVMRPGDDIAVWWNHEVSANGPSPAPTAFTSAMTEWLGRLSVCVIGVSGTGSIVVELLARLGFGEIILIDFDKIERRNLNRILNSTTQDAEQQALKVEMFAGAIRRYRPSCDVVTIPRSISSREAVLAASDADIAFSCVDTAEGRHIADRLAAYLALPLFDVGVSIPTRVSAAGRKIAEVCGRVDYVQPGGSTLSDRGVYTPSLLEAEYLARVAPDIHRARIAEGYLRGLPEQAPAVIALNMRAASACVMEFIARMFPFRHASNNGYARSVFMLADGDEEYTSEETFSRSGTLPVGAGLAEPLLGLPVLAKPRVRT